VWWEDFGNVCLQRHEDVHKAQARRLDIAVGAGDWITGDLELEAQAAQDCCTWNATAWERGGCWGDIEQDDALTWAAYLASQ
jgi:hypothetical protein